MLEQLHCPPGLVYNDDAHSYLLDGVAVPGCSTVLKVISPDEYAGIDPGILERARIRGSQMHAMIALEVRNQLAYESLSPELERSLAAWYEFCAFYDVEVLESERCVASRRYKFAGTLDLLVRMTVRNRRGIWLLDLKGTAAWPMLVCAQTAGYGVAATESIPNYDPKTPRACLRIYGGKWYLQECPDALDLSAFISARTILNYRSKNA